MAARRSVVPYVLVLVWLVWSYAISVAGFGLISRARPSDVGIVYGSLVQGGQPSPRLEARLRAGRDVYVQGLVKKLYVSGATGREGYDESLVMASWLISHGVPSADVVRDSLGRNSALTAVNARAWMTAHGAHQALVVTSYYHVARASMACWQAGVEVNGAAPARQFELRDVYSLSREMVALPVYSVRGGVARLLRH